VDPNAVVRLEFHHPMADGEEEFCALHRGGLDAEEVPGRWEWSQDHHVLTFTPHEPLQHDSEHTRTELPHGKWKRIRFQNDSHRLHPMHLHGQFFKVIAKNGQPVDEPFFRDTVLVHGRETIDVGMVPLDSGRWMMHCHILERRKLNR